MHNDVDHKERLDKCIGNNPFVSMILGGRDDVTKEETELKPKPDIKCEEYLDQIENLVYENRKYLKELEVGIFRFMIFDLISSFLFSASSARKFFIETKMPVIRRM